MGGKRERCSEFLLNDFLATHLATLYMKNDNLSKFMVALLSAITVPLLIRI